MQLTTRRGDSPLNQDGPLDLRLNPTEGVTAAQRLRELDREELAAMLVENADEPYADAIAAAIWKRRSLVTP